MFLGYNLYVPVIVARCTADIAFIFNRTLKTVISQVLSETQVIKKFIQCVKLPIKMENFVQLDAIHAKLTM